MPFKKIELKGVDEVFEALRITKKEFFGSIPDSRWFFRGHGNPTWELKPSVWRSEFIKQIGDWNSLFLYVGGLAFASNTLPFELEYPLETIRQDRCKDVAVRLFAERHLITNFYSIANDVGIISNPIDYDMDFAFEHPNVFLKSPNPHLSALPQHHGVPTRLLDWTRDLLTAFAFALNGSTPDEDVVLWCLNVKSIMDTDYMKSNKSNYAKIQVYEGDNSTNKYLHAQRGAFTYMPNGERYYIENGVYPNVDTTTNDRQLLKFVIKLDSEDKLRASHILMKERKTRAHFMPDLNNCAEYAKQILRLNANFS